MSSSTRSFFRHLVIGHDQFILSHIQYKRILLTGRLCVITIIVSTGYLFLDLINHNMYAWPYELACASTAIVSFLLNRGRRFTAAKILLAFSVNFTVFLFATAEPRELGLYMYFITANLGAMVVFGYEERGKALFFVLLSTGLFIISLFTDIQLLPQPIPYTETYVVTNLMANFIGSSIASVLIIYFLISVNHRSEATLRKNEQEMMRKNTELSKLNTELDRFVYSTSHDLRAPLSSLLGLIQLSEMTSDVNELKKFIGMMRTRIGDLEKFIRDLSDLTRNARLPLDVQPVVVKRLIYDSFEGLRYLQGSQDVVVTIDVPDDLEVMTDKLRLRVILNNIISNAFKYRDTKKETPTILVSARHEKEQLVITVEDNGLGIPESHVATIFDMYVRAHENSEGSGLGLFIVKESIEKMEGAIHVESTIRIGSRFVVCIPAPVAVREQLQASS